jgi:hypothetical protein
MTENGIPDYQLREHPSETTKRLKKQGEWRAADKLLRKVKQAYHRRFKKSGGGLNTERRLELSKAAWDAVHDRWPPPADAKPLESLLEYLQSTQVAGQKVTGKPARTDLPGLSLAAERRFDAIGETDDLTSEVLWVYHNLGNSKVDPLECPSRGAWSLLAHARTDPKAFYRIHVRQAIADQQRRKSDATDHEYKPSKAEKLAVAEIEAMIMEAVAASQLIHCPSCGHGFTEAQQNFDAKPWLTGQ